MGSNEKDYSMEDDLTDQANEQITEDEILKVIPLEEFLESNGRAAFDDDEEVEDENAETSDLPDDSIGTLVCHSQDIFAVATSGDQWVATGGEDDKALLFDLSISESEPVLEISHGDSVEQVAFNAAGSLLATGDLAGKIIITDLLSRQTRVELTECGDLTWMLWHSASDILFAADADGLIWMWLISAQGVAQSKVYSSGTSYRCTSGKLLPDGKRLLAGYENGTLRLWSLKDQSSVSVHLPTEVNMITVHASGTLAAVGTISGDVHLFNIGSADEGTLKEISVLPRLDPVRKEDNHEAAEDSAMEEDDKEKVDSSVESLSFSALPHLATYLAVGRNDGSISAYSLDSKTPRFVHHADAGLAITRVEWIAGKDRPLLLSSSTDSFIRIFDGRDGSTVKEQSCGGDAVLDIAVLDTEPTLRFLAACSGGALRVMQLD